ncbi:TPA: hypothetical protein N0F65_008194, partial [Lagenidium giganteum]
TGQLGLGDDADHALPQRFESVRHALSSTVVTGGCHSGGLDEHGQLYVWGDNAHEWVHLRCPSGITIMTVIMRCVSKVVAVACGWTHTMAVVATYTGEHAVHAWGNNLYFQTGRSTDNDNNSSKREVIDRGLPHALNVASIACGWKHSLLATMDGQAFAWGSGRQGELGLGEGITKAPEPRLITGIDRVGVVHCGWQHTVLQTQDNTVYTCGSNRHGQLGLGARATSDIKAVSTPTQVFVAAEQALVTPMLGVGWHFVLGLDSSGVLYTWGKGSHGQLGQGKGESLHRPSAVKAMADITITHLACGSEHSMVVTNSGELFTCGWGEHGNLGHGDTANQMQFTRVEFFHEQGLHVLSAIAGGAVSMALVRRR